MKAKSVDARACTILGYEFDRMVLLFPMMDGAKENALIEQLQMSIPMAELAVLSQVSFRSQSLRDLLNASITARDPFRISA